MAKEVYTSLEGSPGAIRLLQVLPGDFDDELNCHLYEATLGPSLTYTALSYAWKNHVRDDLGEISQSVAHQEEVMIRCDCSHLSISPNLHSALQWLRNKSDTVEVWVDKLCIDQADIGERNHQVALMRSIYEGSREVVIWLGGCPTDGLNLDGRSAFTTISQLAERGSIDHHGKFATDFNRKGKSIWETQSDNIYMVGKMMDLSWWQRIWVVQETVVSYKATVRYGDVALPWATFAQAAANFAKEMDLRPTDDFEAAPGINMIRDPLANFSRTILHIENTRSEWRTGQPVSLLALLRKFRSREASDERDKIFALIGLVTSWQRVTPLVPDYALSTEDVLWTTTVRIIASTQSLSVLEGTLSQRTASSSSETQQMQDKETGPKKLSLSDLVSPLSRIGLDTMRNEASVAAPKRIPSWVADWTLPPMLTETERLRQLKSFNASAGSIDLVQVHGTSILEVQGFIWDEVKATGDALPDSKFSRKRAIIEQWLRMNFQPNDIKSVLADFSQGAIKSGTRLEAFASSICGGLIYDKSNRSSNQNDNSYRRAYNSDFTAFRQWFSPDRYSNRRTTIIGDRMYGWTDVELNQKTNSLQFAIETASSGRSFFVGRRGYMGVGPSDIRAGDLVCVIMGSRVPFILRPNAGSMTCCKQRLRVLIRSPDRNRNVKECSDCHQRLFTVVGDAYVHGIMDGEVIKATQEHRVTSETLYLV